MGMDVEITAPEPERNVLQGLRSSWALEGDNRIVVTGDDGRIFQMEVTYLDHGTLALRRISASPGDRGGEVAVWRQLPRSLALDTVRTTPAGLQRSTLWRRLP